MPVCIVRNDKEVIATTLKQLASECELAFVYLSILADLLLFGQPRQPLTAAPKLFCRLLIDGIRIGNSKRAIRKVSENKEIRVQVLQ